jgi:beta-lactamase class A
MRRPSDVTTLESRIDDIAGELGDGALAVAVFDYETGFHWSRHGDRWFHAASTIKVAILLALADAIAAGRFDPGSRLHVRNRFLSALDGSVFAIAASRDGDRDLHQYVGKTMRLDELARRMIVRSSNLATNLLLDLVGVTAARETLARRGLTGVELARGVEDDLAFDAGINNRMTADGYVRLLREIHDQPAMVDILCGQEFRSGIPAGIPAGAGARVANKTGEISSAAHDGGLVWLPDRRPYALAVLTEDTATSGRMERIARVSSAVYESLNRKSQIAHHK